MTKKEKTIKLLKKKIKQLKTEIEKLKSAKSVRPIGKALAKSKTTSKGKKKNPTKPDIPAKAESANAAVKETPLPSVRIAAAE